MPQFLTSLRVLWRHPLNDGRRIQAVLRWLRFQLARRTAPGPFLVPLAGSAQMLVSGGDHVSLIVYTGLFDYEEMLFTAHFLRPGDLFADVGANVGVYTVIASAVAGASTTAFEPVSATCRRLRQNIALNGIADLVDVRCAAAGATQGKVRIRNNLDARNHVIDGSAIESADATEVEMVRLDSAVSSTPILMKIDVEGYEAAVLSGATELLDDPHMLGLIIELTGHGNRFGFDEVQLRSELAARGFHEYRYHPSQRSIERVQASGQNALFLRSTDLVAERLHAAPAVWVPHVGAFI